MEQNILLILEYDGTAYHGWQRQKNGRSVQQCLEQALSRVYGERIVVHGAGRTDAGVHALGQTASFRAHQPLPLDRLATVAGHQLPPDIRIRAAREVEHSFHARYSATGKRYRYLIEQGGRQSAFSGRYSWNVGGELDIEAMRRGAALLLGEHDFRHYTLSGVSAENFVRSVSRLDISTPALPEGLLPWQCLHDPLGIEVTANGFLYKMVRLMVGRLVAVGQGRIAPQQMGQFLDGSYWRNIPPAPPQGLMLMEVYYPANR